MNKKFLPLYTTDLGQAFVGDAIELLAELKDSSVDLVMTSPPFALRRQKAYGNVEESEYVGWIKPFGKEGLIAVFIPSGMHAVKAIWQGTIIENLSNWISFITIVGTLILLLSYKQFKKLL